MVNRERLYNAEEAQVFVRKEQLMIVEDPEPEDKFNVYHWHPAKYLDKMKKVSWRVCKSK